MACNCKRKIEVEEKYGVVEYENWSRKVIRYFFRAFFMVFTIVASMVIIPIMILVSCYKAFFGDGKITLPNFLGKYMRENGEKLQDTYEHK